jgi:hypothetical protein
MWWSAVAAGVTIPAAAITRIYALGGMGGERRALYSVPAMVQGQPLDWDVIWCEPCGIQWPLHSWYCTYCHNVLKQGSDWLSTRLLNAEFGQRPAKRAEFLDKWNMPPEAAVSADCVEDRRNLRLAETREREARAALRGEIFAVGIQNAKRMIKKARGHEDSRAFRSGQGLPIYAGWADRYDRDPAFRAECRNATPPKPRIIWFHLNEPGNNAKSGFVRPVEMKWLLLTETMGVDTCCVEERENRAFPDRSLLNNAIVEQNIAFCPLEMQPVWGDAPHEQDIPGPVELGSDEEDFGDVDVP